MILDKLNPLTKGSSELAFVQYDDVKPIIGDTVYDGTEDDYVKAYNSTKYVPQLIFLGLDERKEGWSRDGAGRRKGRSA